VKSNKRILLVSAFMLLLIILTACKEEQVQELEYPLNGPIPQSDIVFMPGPNPVHTELDTKTLGFINADGSNRQEYTFTLVGGSLSNFGYQMPTRLATHPQWSMDGDEIVFSIRDLPPNIRLIAQDGKMYGQNCLDVGRGGTFDLWGNIFIMITPKSPFYEQYKDIADPGLIARYDLKACEIVDVFSVPIDTIGIITEIQEADNGLLVASFWDNDAEPNKIMIYNQSTGEFQTFHGYFPSLTKEGGLLAYYRLSGMLVVRDTETGEERKIELLFQSITGEGPDMQLISMPGWSPDNQWLVYNTLEGDIFKINIETRENIYLTYGWLPDWR